MLATAVRCRTQLLPEFSVLRLVLMLLLVLPASAWAAGMGYDDARHLLTELAEGLAAFKSAMQELNR